MENKIDYIITLSDNTKHMVMDQGNYNGKCYFLTSILDSNDKLSSNFTILEETKSGDKTTVKSVTDERLLDALIEYFKKRFEVNA